MKSPLLQQVVDSEGHMHIQSQKVPLGIQVAIDLSCCCGVACPVQIEGLFAKIPVISNVWTHALSIKYRLITKIIAQLVTNLRDGSFKSN